MRWLLVSLVSLGMALQTGAQTLQNPFFQVQVDGGWLRSLQVDPSGKGNYVPSRFLGLVAGDDSVLSLPPTGEGRIEGYRLIWQGATLLVPRQSFASAVRQQALRLEPGHTLAQEFELGEAGLTVVEVNCPTWLTTGSGMTLSLWRWENSAWQQIVQQKFTNVQDNRWVRLVVAPQPAGRYRVQMRDPVGTIGWWVTPERRLPGSVPLRDGQPVAEGERCMRLWLFDVRQADVLYSLEGNRLQITVQGSEVKEWVLLTPWGSEGTDVTDPERIPFRRFFSDSGRYLPVEQLKRRDELDWGVHARDWLEMTGNGTADYRWRNLNGELRWAMTADQMRLSLRTGATVTLELLPHDERRLPAFYPRFFSSNSRLDDLMNRFYYERAFSWPLAPALADWMEWLARTRYWVALPGFHARERAHLLHYKLDEDGYVYTWGDRKEWPFPDNEKYDARHFTTNANFILGCWRYYCWTGDKEFLRRNIARIRRAMEWELNECEGAEGLFVITSPEHDGTTKGLHSNYWDNIPFGHLCAYEDIYFYASLQAMAEIESVMSQEKTPNAPTPRTPSYYRQLAQQVKRRYDQPDRLCGGNPMYFGGKPYINGWAVGTDIPFPESGLVPTYFLYGFLGVEARVDGLHISPRLPSDLTFAGVRNLFYRGLLLDLRVQKEGEGYRITLACSQPGHRFRIQRRVREGETWVFRQPPAPARFPDIATVIGADWRAEWIWMPGQWETPNITVYARRTFDLLAKPIEATLWVSADNRYRLWVNGVFVGEDDDFAVAERYDVTRLLKLGRNLLAVQVDNVDGPGGLLLEMRVRLPNGQTRWVISDPGWKVTDRASTEWHKLPYDDSRWLPAETRGQAPVFPWGMIER
jgi:hypothetical protein